MASSSYRVEAERWLTIAEKLLTARDLHGAKTFAIRARESDPRLFEFSEQIIAVVDTLLAGELRISSNNNHLDYYAILQLPRLTQSMELIATQYRKLALLLNPTRNRLSYSDHAFKLVSEAWIVFSNPSKKAMYDRELELSQLVQLGQTTLPHQQQFQLQHNNRVIENEVPNTMSFMPELSRQHQQNSAQPTNSRPAGFQPVVTEPIRPAAARPANPEWINRTPAEPSRASAKQNNANTTTAATATTTTAAATAPTPTVAAPPPSAAQPNLGESEVPSFWTSCPYCFYMYEYPEEYVECALKCQNCKRAFHSAEVPAPPLNGKDNYFCCWGYFPLGFSGKGKGGFGGSSWSPFSGMFATPLQEGGRVNAGPGIVKKRAMPKPKVIYKDDVYIELSDPSEDDSDDDDWGRTTKKMRSVRGRGLPNKIAKKSHSERGKKVNGQNVDGGGSNGGEETGGKGQTSSGKRKGAKDLGKLDLNVMFNNEGDETVPGAGGSGGHGPRHGAEEDNIEGISFFEGLDEFLSSLPILSVVGDDKAKAN